MVHTKTENNKMKFKAPATARTASYNASTVTVDGYQVTAGVSPLSNNAGVNSYVEISKDGLVLLFGMQRNGYGSRKMAEGIKEATKKVAELKSVEAEQPAAVEVAQEQVAVTPLQQTEAAQHEATQQYNHDNAPRAGRGLQVIAATGQHVVVLDGMNEAGAMPYRLPNKNGTVGYVLPEELATSPRERVEAKRKAAIKNLAEAELTLRLEKGMGNAEKITEAQLRLELANGAAYRAEVAKVLVSAVVNVPADDSRAYANGSRYLVEALSDDTNAATVTIRTSKGLVDFKASELTALWFDESTTAQQATQGFKDAVRALIAPLIDAPIITAQITATLDELGGRNKPQEPHTIPARLVDRLARTAGTSNKEALDMISRAAGVQVITTANTCECWHPLCPTCHPSPTSDVPEPSETAKTEYKLAREAGAPDEVLAEILAGKELPSRFSLAYEEPEQVKRALTAMFGRMISEAERHVAYGFHNTPGSGYSIRDVQNVCHLPDTATYRALAHALQSAYLVARRLFIDASVE